MAQKIDDERLAQSVVYSFMGEQAPNVEEIARMLAIKRRNNLAGVKVCETYDLAFRQNRILPPRGPIPTGP